MTVAAAHHVVVWDPQFLALLIAVPIFFLGTAIAWLVLVVRDRVTRWWYERGRQGR